MKIFLKKLLAKRFRDVDVVICFCLNKGSLWFVSEFFFCEFFETLEILSAIVLPIKSPVASTVFELYFLN